MVDDDTNRSQTPPTDNSSPRSSRQSPDENPFDAVRRFADENISSMLQSVTGLPSMATPPTKDQWSVFADEHNCDNAHLRQAGDGTERDSTNTNSSGPGDARSRSEDPLDAYRYHSPRRDYASLLDSVPFGFRSMFPSLDENWDDRATWPSSFLLFSPYSPLCLEWDSQRAQRDSGVFSSLKSSVGLASDHGKDSAREPRWTEAFEDLMRLENGKPMLDREPGAEGERETGTNWLRGMVQRGSLGDQWTCNQTDGNFDVFSIFKRGQFPPTLERPALEDNRINRAHSYYPQTEQDFFMQILQSMENDDREALNTGRTVKSIVEERIENSLRQVEADKERHLEFQRKHPPHVFEEIDAWITNDANKDKPLPESIQSWISSLSESRQRQDESSAVQPRVVSTHTNTNRVRMPDGSVQTKTVKKQRFANGHEESNESVDVVNPLERQDPAAASAIAGQEGSANDEQSSGGWFWKR